MKRKTAIHQFHSGSAYGDAVTNSMLLIKRMLCRLGFVSEIYVEQVAPELAGQLQPYKNLKPKPHDLLLIHHSMGHDLVDWLLGLPGKKILVYHNITPAHFFPEASPHRYYSILGREQLTTLLPAMASAICDSRFNADELVSCGYTDVHEIPLLLDIDALQHRQWDNDVVIESAGIHTILFVGRVVSNKCQEDLIRVARHLKQMMDRPFQLVLVGGYSENDPCYCQLRSLIAAFGLKDCIRFTGKISDARLHGWYRAADLFLCMSEHEGFGVPLIEAMAFDVPVVAYKSSNVPHTMGGAGILVTRKDHKAIAALIRIISRDRALKRAIVRQQRRRISDFREERLFTRLSAFLTELGVDIPDPWASGPAGGGDRLLYRVEGPFETSYSLALVNREIAFALERILPGRVGVFATEGPGDYEPDMTAVRSIPGLERLWKNGRRGSRADVVVRNLYPPRVSGMDGQIHLLYFAWEESMLPVDWAESFNRHLDGLPVLSGFIEKILIDNGVSVPAVAAGCGVDHLQRLAPSPYPLAVKADFKFLHISSCFPRKGVDLLLTAFADTFTDTDSVCLVIKTFPNAHNTIEAQVKEIRSRSPQCPPIEIINRDLAPEQIVDLYRQCDALVAPSRGEGFGLPMAEAMWYGLPVITTAYGGQSDFCTDRTSWLIDFSFQPARSHMNLFNSVWMEPDIDHLGRLMHEVRYASTDQLQPRLDAAKKLIKTRFSWDSCVRRMRRLEQRIVETTPLAGKKYRLGWISSWNCKCGIATYSKFLLDSLLTEDVDLQIFASKSDTTIAPDGPNVIRCWTDCRQGVDALLEAVAGESVDVLVIQFNFAFFSSRSLERIIQFTEARGIVSIIFFHSTADVDLPGFKASLRPVTSALARADRLLVHSVEDLNRFKSRGLYKNAVIFPHGVFNRQKKIQRDAAPLIASYGFMLPHKGLEQLIEAFAILRHDYPDLRLRMVNALYPGGASGRTRARCRNLIQTHGLEKSVTMITDFLEDEESLALLDNAAMIVFPYQDTAESASGAVRYGLATHRPVVCTPLDIFSDVNEVVHRLPGTAPEDIAAGIEHLLQNTDLLNSKQEIQDRWLAAHSWEILGKRLNGMINGLSGLRHFHEKSDPGVS